MHTPCLPIRMENLRDSKLISIKKQKALKFTTYHYKMAGNKRWTDDEVDYLKKYYGAIDIEEIANKTKR